MRHPALGTVLLLHLAGSAEELAELRSQNLVRVSAITASRQEVVLEVTSHYWTSQATPWTLAVATRTALNWSDIESFYLAFHEGPAFR